MKGVIVRSGDLHHEHVEVSHYSVYGNGSRERYSYVATAKWGGSRMYSKWERIDDHTTGDGSLTEDSYLTFVSRVVKR